MKFATGFWGYYSQKNVLGDVVSHVAFRKQSAALPFDLAAAKSGDAVIFNNETTKLDADFSKATMHLSICKSKMIVCFLLNGIDFDCPSSLLTMQHPRRLGVNYG